MIFLPTITLLLEWRPIPDHHCSMCKVSFSGKECQGSAIFWWTLKQQRPVTNQIDYTQREIFIEDMKIVANQAPFLLQWSCLSNAGVMVTHAQESEDATRTKAGPAMG